MKFLRSLTLILITCMTGFLNAQETTYKIIKDIQYSNAKDEYSQQRCKLDVYYPENLTDCPVVVWFHGGGLTSGSKSMSGRLKDKGIVVISANYRLLPNVTIDECLDDCAKAVAWAFKNCDKFGGSNKKIFISGHSAGGYITAMLGLDKSWLAKYDIDANSIAGLVPFSGQMISHFSYRNMHGIPNLQPTIDKYAPLFHVRPDCPPLVLITGDRDIELFGRYEENAYMWRMMKLVGSKTTSLYEIGGHGHGPMGDPAYHILLEHMKEILNKEDK